MGALAEIAQRQHPSDVAGLRRLGSHLALLGGTAVSIRATLGSGWVVPAMLLHGIVLVTLFAPLHESTHRTAFRARWLDDLVAGVTGFVLFMPAVYFRSFHLAHHRFTQDRERDPELQTPKPATRRAYLRHVSGVDHWREHFAALVRHSSGRVAEPWVSSRERARIAAEARLHLGAYLAIAVAVVGLGWTALLSLLYYWLLPAVVGQPVLRLYLLAEHTGCPLVGDGLANTRTTLTQRWVRFLMWNMPYHAEHHAAPGVPFYALPALHAATSGALSVTAPGYMAFHRRYARSLRGRAAPERD